MASIDRPSVDGMGLTLVDISVRQADKGGNTAFRVESAIAAISESKLETLGTGGRRRGKENFDVQDGGTKVLGNVISKNLIQAEATMEGSSLLISLKESQMGVLEHMVLLA